MVPVPEPLECTH